MAAVGTDCVDVTGETFAECWSVLQDRVDVVFGPTKDGGYYLVAMTEFHPALFSSIPWSSEVTLARSLQKAENDHLKVETLQTFADIDTAEDWELARAEHFSEIDTL